MARPLRIEYEGALYHITSRGNERNPIYRDEEDYGRFLEILSELPRRYGVIIHGYVLMVNHYHLLVETPRGNITKAMHYLNTTYTGYFNKRYRRVGHLFQGRYKGFLIEKERYLLSVSRYVHLNPVRAGIIQRPEEYKWSSYREYIGKAKKKGWLTCDWILGQYSREGVKARRLYKAFTEEGLTLKENPFSALRAGLILGDEAFMEKIREKIKIEKHREIPESRRLAKAITYEDVLTVVARVLKVSEQRIKEAGRRDNTARKISFYLLRRYTDKRNEEIARYFGIGYTAVSQAVSRLKKEMAEDKRLKKTVESLEEKLSEE